MAAIAPLLLPVPAQDGLDRLPLFGFTSFQQLRRVVYRAFFPEYLSVPVFYFLGQQEMQKTSYFLLVLFLVAYAHLQLSAFKYLVEGLDIPKEGFRRGETLQQRAHGLRQRLLTIMGIPVRYLGLFKWQFYVISLAPNSLNVICTVQAIAAVERHWAKHEEAQEAFRRQWYDWGMIGAYVGNAGLPNIAWFAVAMNMSMHFFWLSLAWCSKPKLLFKLAESANLYFLEKASDNPEISFHEVRTKAAVFSKIPMIWVKISLLALLYDSLDWAGTAQLLVAIFLALYSLVPLLPGWCFMMRLTVDPREEDHGGNIPRAIRAREVCQTAINFLMLFFLLAFAVELAVVLAYLAGVFICPSHSLSVVHGCSAKLG